ncbi:MAG TPA: hypothetical protein VL357_03570 [Rariglobus sp.]|jgi:hypothetical protein|nr:hypothetical protein [Rariglobus sp.]
MNTPLKICTTVSVMVLGLLSASPASATLFSYEPFAYSIGSPLDTQNGGSGFSSAWTASNSTIVSGSLSSGSLPTSGDALSITAKVDAGASGLGANTYRPFTSTLGGAGQDVWVSFLIKTTNSSSYGGLVVGSGSASTGAVNGSKGIFIGYSGGVYAIGPNGASSGISGGTATNGTTQFLVADFSYTTATTGIVSLYLSATPGGSLGTAVGSTSFTLNSFNQIGFATTGSVTFDEIRIGDSFAAVSSAIPEPAQTSALFGLATAGIIFVYRIRRTKRNESA